MGPGLAICEHSLISRSCKLCKNSSICEHNEGGGAGGEMHKDKRQKETKHKQEGLQGKGKGEPVEKRKHPLSEGAGTAGKAQ